MVRRQRSPSRRLRHPAHEGFRNACRVLGPLGILVGFIMIVAAVYDFSDSFGDFDKDPDLFWLAFPGMLILIGGIWLTKFGYLGAAARYVAGETAPVATDAVNYVARGTKESVKEIAGAVAEGIRRTSEPETVIRCHKCNAENDADAKFCKACGAGLGKSVACPACNELNDPDAKFCDNCGGRLNDA